MFGNEKGRRRHAGYYLPKLEIMIDVMINGQNYFDYSVNNDVRKIFTREWDNYTNGCQLDFPYFKENYKVISIDLSKQRVLDADPRVMQQISFTGSL